jgi:hypothetical protein
LRIGYSPDLHRSIDFGDQILDFAQSLVEFKERDRASLKHGSGYFNFQCGRASADGLGAWPRSGLVLCISVMALNQVHSCPMFHRVRGA